MLHAQRPKDAAIVQEWHVMAAPRPNQQWTKGNLVRGSRATGEAFHFHCNIDSGATALAPVCHEGQ